MDVVNWKKIANVNCLLLIFNNNNNNNNKSQQIVEFDPFI